MKISHRNENEMAKVWGQEDQGGLSIGTDFRLRDEEFYGWLGEAGRKRG